MKNLKIILPYIRKYKLQIAAGFLFVLISNVAATLSPRFVGKVIDLISTANFGMDRVLPDILAILGLTILSAVFMSLTRRFIISVSRKIEYDLRRDFF